MLDEVKNNCIGVDSPAIVRENQDFVFYPTFFCENVLLFLLCNPLKIAIIFCDTQKYISSGFVHAPISVNLQNSKRVDVEQSQRKRGERPKFMSVC